MKVSLNWIKDYADIPADIHEYTEAMTMSGTKVEGYELLGDDITGIVVGKILSTEKHPDSDHLIICKVDVASAAPLQIVTGAQNVKTGDIVPVCTNGAHLPGGKVIKTGKLRGVLSEGMLCSISELGLTLHDFPKATDDGIFILQDSLENCEDALGQDIRDLLLLSDTLVDFELTFNRPDCLAFLGIARETAATFGTPLRYTLPAVPAKNNGETVSDYVAVKVENSALCPRYTAKVVKNVKVGTSPLWMRARLRACGIRPISNIVDITNYVMLEYGQPMHAFDKNFITSGTIVVRNARKDETIVTLDGVERKLEPSMLCIADGEKPIALAGIMGGENSEITDSTETVVFESANFNRENVRLTSRAVGLRTESSKRFEKGLPPYNAQVAVERACELVELLGCGEVVDGCIDICAANLNPTKVAFCPERINALLGTDISREDMTALLAKLEMTVTEDGKHLIVPPYRNDIINTADIAEEVVRLYGVDKIEATRFEGRACEGKLPDTALFSRKAENACVSLGFSEIYTYSFISPSLLDKIRVPADDERRNMIKLINPIGDETSVMRTTALPSMLSCIAANYNRRILAGNLFENATVYGKSDSDMSSERKIICMAFYGEGDFYDMKGYVEALLENLNVCNFAVSRNEDNPSYHPGRCASVTVGNHVIGVFGQIHPSVAEAFGIDTEVYAAELELGMLYSCRKQTAQYVPIPVYPAIERDLALVMDEAVEAGDIASHIASYAGKSLVKIAVFDVYRGKGIDEGKKSIAYRLTFRLNDRTLSDDEVEASVQKILKKLSADCGVVLRS